MKLSKSNSIVSIVRNATIDGYPKNPPFDPPQIYPEYPFNTKLEEENFIYPMVREALSLMGLDKRNIGEPEWNPFGNIIAPGSTVLIKPNFVKEFHNKNLSVNSMIVHGSVIRPIIDYVYIALKGNGKIIVADTPIEKADFKKICLLTGIEETIRELNSFSKININLIDLRQYQTIIEPYDSLKRKNLPGDPLGYIAVDLGDKSELSELDGNSNYYTLGDHSVNHYNPYTMDIGLPNKFHHTGVHIYNVGKTVLSADTIISVAKMKTHKKAGVTLNLKNMIGIVQGKEYIPHHRPGSPPDGDAHPCYPKKIFLIKRNIKRSFVKIFLKGFLPESIKKIVEKNLKSVAGKLNNDECIEWGDWSGNDTLWRTILDINKIVFYADKDGKLHNTNQRNYFCFVDGITAMEGDGPMSGDPINTKLIIASNDPVSCDTITTKIMGFDNNKIKTIKNAGKCKYYPLGRSNPDEISIITTEDFSELNFHFKAPNGWRDCLNNKFNSLSKH